ncbi:MAG: transposase [Actinomycetota bacterium]|jgi:transposase|nr:transposase [Actinomycetota bacterium]
MDRPDRWSEEFREEALISYLSRRHEMSANAVARELGVPANTFRRWIKKHDAEAHASAPKSADNAREVARLQRQNEVLREENEILKKAAAFFARETGSSPPRRSGS